MGEEMGQIGVCCAQCTNTLRRNGCLYRIFGVMIMGAKVQRLLDDVVRSRSTRRRQSLNKTDDSVQVERRERNSCGPGDARQGLCQKQKERPRRLRAERRS